MSESKRTNQKKRGVRFTEESIANGSERLVASSTTRRHNSGDRDDDDNNEPPRKRHKRSRRDRPNEDEIDDLDDFVPDDDDDRDIPSESQTLRAKRERRLKQAHDDDDENIDASTRIDRDTSLAAEGIEVEPFHMKQESNDGTGYFDGDTYVFRKRDAGEEPDAWLESIEGKEDEMIEASAAKANAKKYGNGNDDDDDDDDDSDAQDDDTSGSKIDTWTDDELYAQIIPYVSDSETVMQAIARYGNLLKRGGKEGAETALAKKALNDVTEASSALMMRGQHDIYQKTRRNLSQFLSANEGLGQKDTDESKVSNEEKPVVQWEYQGSQDGQVHGPYTTQQMQGWIQQGYFVGPSAVMIRSIHQEDVQKEMKDDLLSDLLDDDDDDDGDDVDDTKSGKRPPATKTVRGDWTKSDQVDFFKYV